MRDEIKDNGGPAFPLQSIGPDFAPGYAGMTLRDWFAGQAATGLLAHPDCGSVGPGHEGRTAAVAREAYAIADAMLSVRGTIGDPA